MRQKIISLVSSYLENGSGMNRKCFGIDSFSPRKLFTLLFVLLLGVGQMWGTEDLVYTLDGTTTATGNAYATASDVTQSSKSWKVTANTEQNPWRIGGKSISNVNRDIYSTFAFTENISKVTVDVGATASSLTLNSVTLKVSSAQDGGGTVTSTLSKTSNLTSTTLTFERPANTDWSGKYFTIVFNVTRSSSSDNGYVTFNNAKFYKEAAASYTITAQSNNTTYGTVSLSGSVITGSPNSGYRYASPAYSVSPANSATVSQNGNTFTVTPSATTTVTINFEAIPEHNINFNTGGLVTIPSVSVAEGVEYNVSQTPAASLSPSCEYSTFVGWTTESSIADPSAKPTLIANGKVTMSTSDINLYAVYSKTTGGGGGSTEETKSVSISTYASAHSWANSTQYTSVEIDENITATAIGGGNTGKYYTSGTEWRFYQTESAKLRITAADGCTLKSATLTFGVSNQGQLSGSDGAVTSGEAYTISGDKYDFSVGNSGTATNGQVKFTAISVTYDKPSSGTTTYSLDANCCTPHAITIASGIENGSVTADKATACEDEEITLTPSANPAYHFYAWDVYKTGASATKVTVTNNKFDMPDYDVTVSATFEHDACTQLATPANIAASNNDYPYDAVALAWDAVEHADKYKVYIYTNEDVEIEHDDAVATNSYTISTTLAASTTYKVSVQAISNTPADYCESEVANTAFGTNALPTAHLTLMNLGVAHASSGDYAILTPFNLPTTAAACSKAFVGWDADPDCATAPTYEKGAEFTFANTTGVTLYAVYADAEAGDVSYTKLTSDAFDAEATYIIAAEQTPSDATMWYLNSCANTDQNNGYGFMTTDPENNAPIQFQLSGIASALKIREVSGAKRYLKGLTTGNFQMSASEQTLTLSNAGAIGSSSNYILRHNYNSGNGGLRWYSSNTGTIAYLYKVEQEFTYSNYATTCVAAPEAIVDPEELNVAAAGVANGIIEADYDNVNESAVAVSLWNNQACDEAFDGGWLTASINEDKNIAYTIAENTSYNDARTAYIKLTAPETNGATDPAIVKIPVSQLKKAAVFASLQDLVDADVNANTPVTVTFSNVVIKEMYEYNDKVCGVVFNIQKAGEDIKIYFNSQETISDWVAGGKLSGTLTNCPWKIYSEAWQLAPASGWAWANLEYTEPASVSSVAVSGTPTKTTYNTGEAFDPAGLTVTVTYSDSHVETITANDDEWAYVSWTKDPATFAAEHIGTGKSVTVTATYNAVASSAAEISGLTVNKVAVTGVTLNQDAATLKVGKTLTLTATVAPANASIKSVSWESDDTDIATVDENGVVTAVAEGSATITATSTDDNTKYATCAITITESINFAAGDWTLVTDAAELTAGSYVIIAAAGYDKAMKSYESGNNCKAKDATKSGDLLTYDEAFGIFEVGDYEISDVTYKTFQDVNTDQYLYLNTNNNYLKAQDTKNADAAWTITNVLDAGKAVVTSKSQSSRTMRYNDNSDLFACYASGQKDIALYKYFAPVPKVTYNKNTEDEVTDLPAVQKTVWEDDAYKATVAAGPSRYGYTFTGWNSDAEGNGDAYAIGTKYSFAADITLYAQWEALTAHHVTYVTVGTAPTDANSYYVGDEVTLASAAGLSNPGYVFDGWNDGTSTYTAGFDEYEMPDNDVTFTAVWSRKSSQKWVLVTDIANIKTDGTEYVIAGAEHNVAMGALNGSYYNSTSVTKNDNILTGTEQMIALTFGAGSESGKYTIKHGTKYIYSTTVKNMGERDDSFDWEIVIADGVATISASVGDLKYNSQNPRFNTYASGQQPVAIYEKAENVVVTTSQAVSGISAGADVIVKNGGTLNVDADKSIGDLTVEAGGKVVLDENKLTVVGTFAIETTMASGASGQINGATASNFAAAGEAYIDITLSASGRADQWHAFTVPFPVDALNGIYDLDGGKLTNEVNYAIMDYHGDIRATGKYGWKKYRKTLVPGTFYLMTVDGLRTTYRFKKAAGAALVAENSKTIYEYAADGDGEDSDAGWNGVGNPTLSYGQVDVPVQVLDPDAYEYQTKPANSTNFVVGTPFFYKASADGSIMMQTADAGASYYAPARRGVREIKDLDITFGNEAYKDHLYISASEDAINSYEQDKDLVKMRMSKTPKVAQIMAEAYGCELSMVNAPMVNDEARYALSLYAPAAGEYTISSDAMALAEDGSQLYLTYNGYPMWNLTSSPMTVTLPKGNSTQFGLLITRPALMPTGVDEVTGDGLQVTGVEKLIIDDHIYILRDGKMYDVTGEAVK